MTRLFRPMLTFHAVVLLLSATALAEQSYPNVIVILADDMGLDSVSAFNDKLGLATPNIDRLASEGMSFTDAHSTSAVCTPTRYSVLTGRYNWRSRLKRGIVGQWERPLIEDERTTLPEMFREKSYHTACIGKWHLGWNWPDKAGGSTSKLSQIDFTKPVTGGPIDHGFDTYFGDDVPNWPPYAWRKDDRVLGKITTTMKQGTMVGVGAGPAVEDWDFRAVLSEYSRRWHDYVASQAASSEPFFLYAPMPSPHTPIAPGEQFRGHSGISEYADFVGQTDHAVGQILAALDETDQTENTLVFFTCDNGTSPKADFPGLLQKGVRLNEHWRGWKADAYEGGHRVPFIVRWPKKVPRGSTSPETITLADIMATCAEVVNFSVPETCAEDSVSLLPVLLGKTVDQPLHESIVHHSISGHFAIRRGPWKLLLCAGSGGWSPPREAEAKKQNLPRVQLFNLSTDPKETNNLAGSYPERVNQMQMALRLLVETGRSTPGDSQPNHNNAKWWPGLPWKNPSAN